MSILKPHTPKQKGLRLRETSIIKTCFRSQTPYSKTKRIKTIADWVYTSSAWGTQTPYSKTKRIKTHLQIGLVVQICKVLNPILQNKKDILNQKYFANSRTKCKIFGFILTSVNQTLKKPAGLPSGWGRVAPKERKI